MPKILDYESFCENLEEVTSLKTVGKRKFHPEGLFSEQIFGPVKNYTCQCGTYYGVSKSGGKCEICKVDITNSDERRTRFAKITLPMKVINPLFYDLLVDIGGKSLKAALDDLMRMEKSVLYMDNDEHVVTTVPENLPRGTKIWEKTDAIEKLITDLAEKFSKEGIAEWKLVKYNIKSLFLSRIIVLPPDLRPTSKSTGNRQLMDKINRYYVQILTKKDIMKDTTVNINIDKNMYYTYFKQLQGVVNELYDQILTKMAKKEGLIRGNILGKRIDFSGRAVISPDPTLNLNECVLPYLMVLEIFKLPIAKKIIELGKFKLLNKAIDFVDKCIDTQSPALFKICEDIVDGEICILNRQPSLHRLGMLGFKIKISLDQVIKIHPLVCPPFNADFDGDQMAVYIPVTEEAKQEVIDKMFVTENLNSPANETLTTTPSQDIILGIYFLTSEVFDVDGNKIFNSCLPEDYPEIKGVVNSKRLLEILNDIKDKYHQDEVATVLDNIKREGFKYATLYGCTLSLEDFNVGLGPLRDSLYSHENIRQQLEAVSSNEVIDQLRDKFAYSYMIESGARGSWDQVKQLILTRGFISNFDGEILPLPIKHNLIEGLTEEEFFYSTYGCRKGLLDVALNTGTSGYLSRKLIFTCANLQIDEVEDCGTTDFLEVNVKDRRKAFMLVNRYALSEDGKQLYKLTKDNCIGTIGKTIKIRSPILCKNPRICKTCYGDLYKTINSRFIGIIAAQTLGERSTQLVLRTFHTSGSAIIKGQDDNVESQMKQKDIIGDLETVASLLHKFPDKDYVTITDKLFDAYDASIYHVHFECVVAQLMWKNYKKWRLLDNRDKVKPNYYSIQSVPNQESWILAMAFSNPKRSILHGILYEGRYSGVMDKILKGEKIS
jgi:DNA-directed RNA polymerase subunit beta'